MSYRVFWTPDAERYFKELHAAATGQPLLVQAVSEIDRQLHKDPLEFGESRFENVRIGFEGPLAVHFEVLEDVETVIVFGVWTTDRR
jgi:hypothetical protein